MKLLIITQKVDKSDDLLGFMHSWILEFAKHCQMVTVICLYKGNFDLPSNVKVFSLGKEKGVSRVRYMLNFFRYIISERNNYDSVFVHMNQVYVVLGGFFWKLMRKKISLRERRVSARKPEKKPTVSGRRSTRKRWTWMT